ncbi:MAG: hypothetical protein WCJ46_03145 [bacterium]
MNEGLHIGDKILLPMSRVIGIFRVEKRAAEYLEKMDANNALRNKMEKPRGFVVSSNNKEQRCYSTKISSRRLIKRAERFEEEINGKER